MIALRIDQGAIAALPFISASQTNALRNMPVRWISDLVAKDR